MNVSMLESFSEIKSEKMIDNPVITKILDDVFRAEIIKKFGSDENFDFVMNPSNGDFEIWKKRTVVSDDKLEDIQNEISLSDVRKIEDDFEVGEEFAEEFKFENLGRRSILNIKQNLKSKFRNYDTLRTVEKFEKIKGEIYRAEINHVRRNTVILIDHEANGILLPKENQIKGEFYKIGTNLSGIIEKSEAISGKPIITMSRSSSEFLEALLESEIPEIFDGLITVKKIARSPGVKSKVVVETYDDRIDPVGVCVGMNGNRINSIVHELSGENIDIINHTENLDLLVSRCLKPAKIDKVEKNDNDINVYLDVSEIGKAVGKGGVNVRLTSEITGHNINIINRSNEIVEDVDLREFNDEIDDWVIDEFVKIGLDTAKSVLNYNAKTLEDRTDLEPETIEEVLEILKSEFNEEV